MNKQAHIAVDLGAESGRVIMGILNEGRLILHETHRFRHLPVPTPGGLCWDITGLWQEILVGLSEAAEYAKEHRIDILSVGVDTWGVDWTLLSKAGLMLGLPRGYRDPKMRDGYESVTSQLSPTEIYDATGIQIMPLNTLYQYASRFTQEPEAFDIAKSLVFMPDLLHWLLSGEIAVERTIASTSQMVDVRTGTWNKSLLEQLNLPTTILQDPVNPGTTIGKITPEVATATGLSADVQVVLPPSHDTASAVAAVPAENDGDWCFLSSGTWSLLGAELDQPRITPETAAANFTNELGMAGTTRFLKNIAGLWLVQEIRRDYHRQGRELDYAELTEQAAGAEPFRTLLPVNDSAFAEPGNAISRIQQYANASGQPVPESVGQLIRACLESLALEYRRTLDEMQNVLDKKFSVLHLVGGGGKNGLLNRMTAHATGLPVIVGPEEATAMGNLLCQAVGTGRLQDLAELRQVVRNSIDLLRIEPGDSTVWQQPFQRYCSLIPLK